MYAPKLRNITAIDEEPYSPCPFSFKQKIGSRIYPPEPAANGSVVAEK